MGFGNRMNCGCCTSTVGVLFNISISGCHFNWVGQPVNLTVDGVVVQTLTKTTATQILHFTATVPTGTHVYKITTNASTRYAAANTTVVSSTSTQTVSVPAATSYICDFKCPHPLCRTITCVCNGTTYTLHARTLISGDIVWDTAASGAATVPYLLNRSLDSSYQVGYPDGGILSGIGSITCPGFSDGDTVLIDYPAVGGEPAISFTESCGGGMMMATAPLAVSASSVLDQVRLAQRRNQCEHASPAGCGCQDLRACALGKGDNGTADRATCYRCLSEAPP